MRCDLNSSYLELLPFVRCLQIVRHSLSGEPTRALAAFLRRPDCALELLVLSECGLNTEDALVLASALRGENQDGCDADDCKQEFDDDDLKPSQSSSSSSSSLRSLVLIHNGIGLVGAAAMVCLSLFL